MGEILLLLLLVATVISTLWWPRGVVRGVGSTFVAGLLYLAARPALGPWGALLPAGAVLALCAWGMPQRVLKRVCFMVLSLVLLVFATTWLMFSVPGNPFANEKQASKQVQEALRAKYGISESAVDFFGTYMRNVLVDGTLGPSLKSQGRDVEDLILPAFPVSLSLGILALTIATGLGLFLGVRAGLRPGSWADTSSMVVAMAGISVPSFVIGALFILVFALGLGWLPVAGWGGYRHLLLPALTLALPYAAYIARLARGGTIEVMQQDFIRTARAKGLPERAVVLKHALKGAILPVVSFLGPATAGILTGSFVVETLFTVPGMGQWFVKSAIGRDYSVVLGCALLYCALITVFNLLVDMAYSLLDPRVREEA